MNWGKSIIAILIVFVGFICTLSYFMFNAPADDYDHQYYEDGLNFDHDYNREEQVTKDHAQPGIQVTNGYIRFIFPQLVKGEVEFMRPSSDAADKNYPLDNANGKPVELPTLQLAKGEWQLVLKWKSGQKDYLYHKEVYIQ